MAGRILEAMDQPIRLNVPASLMMISAARNCAAAIAAGMGFSGNEVENVRLSINEALANVIKHAYGGDSANRIDIRFRVEERRLEIRVRDYGRKIAPAEIHSRRLDVMESHGLGVFLMKELMDRVEYDTSPDIGTELVMVKELNGKKRRKG